MVFIYKKRFYRRLIVNVENFLNPRCCIFDTHFGVNSFPIARSCFGGKSLLSIRPHRARILISFSWIVSSTFMGTFLMIVQDSRWGLSHQSCVLISFPLWIKIQSLIRKSNTIVCLFFGISKITPKNSRGKVIVSPAQQRKINDSSVCSENISVFGSGRESVLCSS